MIGLPFPLYCPSQKSIQEGVKVQKVFKNGNPDREQNNTESKPKKNERDEGEEERKKGREKGGREGDHPSQVAEAHR